MAESGGKLMFVYQDEQGEEAIFYHDSTDLEGCALEATRRRDVQAYRDENGHVVSRMMEKGKGDMHAIVAVPNTADVLGVLKGGH
jgi:hypothetical protein